MKKRKTKRRKKTNSISRKILQSLALLFIAIAICYSATKIFSLIKQPNNILILEQGKLSLTEDVEALVIRDEKVTRGENYKNGMLQIKSEGERVAKGEAIFRYYSNNEESIKEKIKEIEQKIQENIPESQEKVQSDVPLIENQIKLKLSETYNTSDLQKIREYKTDINTYMTKKIEIIGELSKDNSEIKRLLKERENYESELTKNSEYVNAVESGVVSYRVDDLEEQLKTDDFSYLNKQFLENINAKTGQIIATSKESGKVINNFECYLAVVLNSSSAKSAKIGDKVRVQFSNAEEINAEINYINVEKDDSRTIVLKITKKIEELVKYRKISLTIIWWDYSGFKVPNSSIKTINSKNYVTKNRTGYKDDVLIKIVRQNDKYAIIDNYSTDELKELGYSTKEIGQMKKINLYDEILVNP